MGWWQLRGVICAQDRLPLEVADTERGYVVIATRPSDGFSCVNLHHRSRVAMTIGWTGKRRERQLAWHFEGRRPHTVPDHLASSETDNLRALDTLRRLCAPDGNVELRTRHVMQRSRTTLHYSTLRTLTTPDSTMLRLRTPLRRQLAACPLRTPGAPGLDVLWAGLKFKNVFWQRNYTLLE